MRNSAECRIRSYYEKLRKELDLSNLSQNIIEEVLLKLKEKLKSNVYHQCYFDRWSNNGFKLCNTYGNFECQGPYNKPDCLQHHQINPYISRESRIIFSTWNLDHVIEKSRCIIPTLIQALKNTENVNDINLDYFYDCLFVAKNHQDLKVMEGTEEGGGGAVPQHHKEDVLPEYEAPDGVHPSDLKQKNPPFIQNLLDFVFSIPSIYCWYMLISTIIAFVLWNKFKGHIIAWRKKQEELKEAAEYHKNPDIFLERENAIQNARLRLQEKYNLEAAEHAKKVAEREEMKRQQRIEEWEKHKQGKGYFSKTRCEVASSNTSSETVKKPSGRPRLRPEYNPLLGPAGGSGYRPSRSSGFSGGG